MTPSKALSYALAATLALGAGIWAASFWSAQRAVSPAELQSGVLLAQPRPIADFTLTDQSGAPFTAANLRDRWSLLFAGFTHCPDVCPTTLGLMKALAPRLSPAPAMLFLSVDPERDTPAALQSYVGFFGLAITGLTGGKEQLDRLCASLGIAYVKVPGATDADYTIDHSAALVLIDPQGRVAGYFTPPHKLDTLAAELPGIIGAAS